MLRPGYIDPLQLQMAGWEVDGQVKRLNSHSKNNVNVILKGRGEFKMYDLRNTQRFLYRDDWLRAVKRYHRLLILDRTQTVLKRYSDTLGIHEAIVDELLRLYPEKQKLKLVQHHNVDSAEAAIGNQVLRAFRYDLEFMIESRPRKVTDVTLTARIWADVHGANATIEEIDEPASFLARRYGILKHIQEQQSAEIINVKELSADDVHALDHWLKSCTRKEMWRSAKDPLRYIAEKEAGAHEFSGDETDPDDLDIEVIWSRAISTL